jgi:hypothetical protein
MLSMIMRMRMTVIMLMIMMLMMLVCNQAHNLEAVASAATSVDLSNVALAMAMEEIDQCVKFLEEEGKKYSTHMRERRLSEYSS